MDEARARAILAAVGGGSAWPVEAELRDALTCLVDTGMTVSGIALQSQLTRVPHIQLFGPLTRNIRR